MKTLTIHHDLIDNLDSDASKLEFANTVISMFEDDEPETNSLTAQALYKGLNRDLPALHISAPFKSKNMSAPEVKRYHMTRAGYVPISLDCRYDDYEYRFLDKMTDSEISSFIATVERKISHSKGKRDFMKFLRYIREACAIYCIESDRENCLRNFNF